MLDAAERTGTAMQVPAPGQRLSLDAHASLAFLAPDPDAVFESVNDYSIISLLSADGLRVLFTGDAEAAAEQALLDSGADIACVCLRSASRQATLLPPTPFWTQPAQNRSHFMRQV